MLLYLHILVTVGVVVFHVLSCFSMILFFLHLNGFIIIIIIIIIYKGYMYMPGLSVRALRSTLCQRYIFTAV
jgi:hypothetical protein